MKIVYFLNYEINLVFFLSLISLKLEKSNPSPFIFLVLLYAFSPYLPHHFFFFRLLPQTKETCPTSFRVHILLSLPHPFYSFSACTSYSLSSCSSECRKNLFSLLKLGFCFAGKTTRHNRSFCIFFVQNLIIIKRKGIISGSKKFGGIIQAMVWGIHIWLCDIWGRHIIRIFIVKIMRRLPWNKLDIFLNNPWVMWIKKHKINILWSGND